MILIFENGKEEDLKLLFRLNQDLIDRYEELGSIDYGKVLHWVRGNLRDNLPRIRRVMADGELAGFFCLCPWEDKWELDSLFVLEGFRNRGIGTGILEHCLKVSSGKLFLYVFRGNTGAVRLYRRMGFGVTAEAGATRYIMEYGK